MGESLYLKMRKKILIDQRATNDVKDTAKNLQHTLFTLSGLLQEHLASLQFWQAFIIIIIKYINVSQAHYTCFKMFHSLQAFY